MTENFKKVWSDCLDLAHELSLMIEEDTGKKADEMSIIKGCILAVRDEMLEERVVKI